MSEQETITQTFTHPLSIPTKSARGIWLLPPLICEEKPCKGALPAQDPEQLCGAEKFIPHKKGRKKTHLISHSVFGFLLGGLCWNAAPAVRDPEPQQNSAPLSPRCDCSVWAPVPLHPPQVLPGLRCGSTGTVRT